MISFSKKLKAFLLHYKKIHLSDGVLSKAAFLLKQLLIIFEKVNQNAEALKKNFLELTELKHILRKTQQFFEEQDQIDLTSGQLGQHQQLLPEEGALAGGGLQLGFVAGVILRERLPAFERMLWRACRGNVFLRQVITFLINIGAKNNPKIF
jgi:hypothetical protein